MVRDLPRHRIVFALVWLGILLPSLAEAQFFGRNKIQYENFDWHVLNTPHFEIFFYEEEEDLAARAAVIAEHEAFLEAAASVMCAIHLGGKIRRDGDFRQALAEYAEAYGGYFCVYCDWVLAEAENRESSTKPLLLFLKNKAMEKRSVLLSAEAGLDLSRPRKPAGPCRSSMEHLVPA